MVIAKPRTQQESHGSAEKYAIESRKALCRKVESNLAEIRDAFSGHYSGEESSSTAGDNFTDSFA